MSAGDEIAGLTLLAPASHPWPGELGCWYQLSASALGQHVVLPMISRVVPRRLVEGSLERVFQPNEVPDGYLDHLGFDLTLRTRQMQINALQIERLEAEVDSVNLTRVKGMGHMPHHADPQLVAETIRRTAERAGVQQ